MDEELLERLRKAARLERKSVNQVLVEAAKERCATTLAGQRALVSLAGAIGVVDSGGGFDATHAREEFAEALEARARDGRL